MRTGYSVLPSESQPEPGESASGRPFTRFGLWLLGKFSWTQILPPLYFLCAACGVPGPEMVGQKAVAFPRRLRPQEVPDRPPGRQFKIALAASAREFKIARKAAAPAGRYELASLFTHVYGVLNIIKQ